MHGKGVKGERGKGRGKGRGKEGGRERERERGREGEREGERERERERETYIFFALFDACTKTSLVKHYTSHLFTNFRY